MLKCLNITKSFGKRAVLKNVSLALEGGRITTLIGPSGSGKTTLIRALSFLDIPDSGSVYLDDVKYEFPLIGRDVPRPWPDVTVVFQNLFLWPHMTLRQNILKPVRWLGRQVMEGEIDDFIKMFEMVDFMDRYPNEVSIGQRQRAAIVRALALHPRYILLDEITSALDVEQVGRVLQCLINLKERGIGVLVVTHLVGFARRMADYVAFIDDGQIIESGGKEVLQEPKQERVRRFLSVLEAAR